MRHPSQVSRRQLNIFYDPIGERSGFELQI